MSSTTDTAAGAAAGTDTVVDLRGMWIGLITLDVFYLIVRIYEQVFGWRAGLELVRSGVPDLLAEHSLDGNSA